MESHISAADAALTFAEVIERVRSRGESFVVERDGAPVCRIEPIAPSRTTVRDLAQLLRTTTRPDDAYFDAVEQVAQSQSGLGASPWEP
jgi:antitoxin (DNA-binding transcriptional repressor) of toxin-antitoxin stability system